MKAGLIASLITCVVVASCGGCAGTPPAPGPAYSTTRMDADMDVVLALTASEADFSVSVERQDGHRYNFSRGTSTLQTSYESASTIQDGVNGHYFAAGGKRII